MERRWGTGMMRACVLGAVFWALPALGADTRPPVVRHVPVSKAVRGSTVAIQAVMTDESALFAPTLYYRSVGAKLYASLPMQRQGEQSVASIKVTGDLEYWIEVYDEVGNGPSLVGAAEKPLKVTVVESAEALSEELAVSTPAPAPVMVAEPVVAPPVPAPVSAPVPAPVPVLSWPETPSMPVAQTGSEPVSAAPEVSRPVDDEVKGLAVPQVPQVPMAGALQAEATATPLYRDAWFMGGLSVMAVGTIVAVVLLATPEPVYRNVFDVTVTAPGGR